MNQITFFVYKKKRIACKFDIFDILKPSPYGEPCVLQESKKSNIERYDGKITDLSPKIQLSFVTPQVFLPFQSDEESFLQFSLREASSFLQDHQIEADSKPYGPMIFSSTSDFETNTKKITKTRPTKTPNRTTSSPYCSMKNLINQSKVN